MRNGENMEISRKKLMAIVGIVLVAAMAISAFSSLTTFVPSSVTMRADPALDISLVTFEDCGCTIPFTSYDWDGVVEGEYYECAVYVKNTGTIGLLITYLPTDLWFLGDEAHFVIHCWVIEFGLPCELYTLDPPVQLPEKDPLNCTSGFFLPPGKVMKVDIVLFVDRIVVGQVYTWTFTFWGKIPCEEVRPAKLTLDKFNDLNGNGIYDAGDVKISGWRIDVRDPHNLTTTYFTPTSLGITEFGTYTVTEDRPSDWVQTAVQVDGVYKTPPTAEVIIDINEGETHSVLYGNKVAPRPAGLVIEKFNDTNGNGVYDEGIDVMISDWKIDVTDPDGVTRTFFTPISLIGILKFGTYTITEDLPSGWVQTAVRVDGSYLLPPTREVKVTIGAGETHDILYGNWVPPPLPAKLIVEKFNDLNSNGVFDGDDVMIVTWEIYVTDPSGVTTTYHTPLSLNITLFGTYIIKENLPLGWEQTAVRVDGVYIVPPTPEVKVIIGAGETRDVLYGNRRPTPPPVGIHLYIRPISVTIPGTVTFSWEIESPPEVTPDYAALYLRDPNGVIIPLANYTVFPPWTGSYAWTSTPPAGSWRVYIVYHYTYLGTAYTVRAYGSFNVKGG